MSKGLEVLQRFCGLRRVGPWFFMNVPPTFKSLRRMAYDIFRSVECMHTWIDILIALVPSLGLQQQSRIKIDPTTEMSIAPTTSQTCPSHVSLGAGVNADARSSLPFPRQTFITDV